MKTSISQKFQYFQDLNTSLEFGNSQADRRLQVKMPSKVVAELDRLFTHIDRSHLLTQLAVNVINQNLKFSDRAVLRQMIASEQDGLDDMLTYLEDRDAARE